MFKVKVKDPQSDILLSTSVAFVESLRSGKSFACFSREGALIPSKNQRFLFYSPLKDLKNCKLGSAATSKLTAETMAKKKEAKDAKQRVQLVPAGATFSSSDFSNPTSGPPTVLGANPGGGWYSIRVDDGSYLLPKPKKSKAAAGKKDDDDEGDEEHINSGEASAESDHSGEEDEASPPPTQGIPPQQPAEAAQKGLKSPGGGSSVLALGKKRPPSVNLVQPGGEGGKRPAAGVDAPIVGLFILA